MRSAAILCLAWAWALSTGAVGARAATCDHMVIPEARGPAMAALLTPHGFDAPFFGGWRFTGLSIASDHATLTLAHGDGGEAAVVLRHPSCVPDAPRRSAHFALTERCPGALPPADCQALAEAVTAQITARDDMDPWRAATDPTTGYAGVMTRGHPPRATLGADTWPVLLALLILPLLLLVARGRRRADDARAPDSPAPGADPARTELRDRDLGPRAQSRDSVLGHLDAGLPPWALPGVLVLALLAFGAPVAWRVLHHALATSDFGIYTEALWNASQGRGLWNSVELRDHLGSHASPSLYLLLPLYMLAPAPLTVALLNAAAVALSLLPAFHLARRRFGARAGLLLALAFALHPGMGALAYDPHAVTLAVPLLLWALAAHEGGRAGWFALAALLAAGCKENVPLVLAFWGLYLLGRGERRAGAALSLGALAAFALGMGLIIPAFRGDHGALTMARYAHLGESWLTLLLSPLLRPAAFWGTLLSSTSLLYLIKLLAPLGFLPLLAPRILLIGLPILMQNLLSAHGDMTSTQHHFDGALLPILFWATLEGLTRLRVLLEVPSSPARVAGALILAAPLLHAWSALPGPLLRPFAHPWADELSELRAHVPADARVASPPELKPYLDRQPFSAQLDHPRGLFDEPAVRDQVMVAVVPREVPGEARRYGIEDFPGFRSVHESAHYLLMERDPP